MAVHAVLLAACCMPQPVNPRQRTNRHPAPSFWASLLNWPFIYHSTHTGSWPPHSQHDKQTSRSAASSPDQRRSDAAHMYVYVLHERCSHGSRRRTQPSQPAASASTDRGWDKRRQPRLCWLRRAKGHPSLGSVPHDRGHEASAGLPPGSQSPGNLTLAGGSAEI